jgi:AraC family transcriptional regulator
MGAVEPVVLPSPPEAITRAVGVRPLYAVRSSVDFGLSAARWRFENLPPVRERLPQSVLAYCAAGSAWITKIADGRATRKRPRIGSVTFDPGDGRTTWSVDGVFETVHVYLPPTSLERMVERAPGAKRIHEIDDFFAIEDRWLGGYFQMLISELETFRGADRNTGSQLLEHTEDLLIGHLVRWHSRADPRDTRAPGVQTRVNPLRPALMRRVEDHIGANLAGDISLGSLAGVACMSVDHFLRSFRAACGLTPYQYVLEQRLRKASAMVKTSNAPIAVIAAQCGFGNPSHFSVKFHARFGVSASRYRRGE